MASCPISSSQKERGKVKTMIGFLFLDSKITVSDDCSHEIKRHLVLGRKAMTNLDSILKSRDTVSPVSPSICHEEMGSYAMILVFCSDGTRCHDLSFLNIEF